MTIARPILRLASGLLLLAWGAAAFAQEDARNSKDHPLLTRYPNSHIVEYEKNFNSVEFAVGTRAGEPQRKAVEGDATIITYFHNSPEKQPSALQVIRNYQNAMKGIGGEVVYERLPKEGDGGETTLKVATGGKEVWVRLEVGIRGKGLGAYATTQLQAVDHGADSPASPSSRRSRARARNSRVSTAPCCMPIASAISCVV